MPDPGKRVRVLRCPAKPGGQAGRGLLREGKVLLVSRPPSLQLRGGLGVPRRDGGGAPAVRPLPRSGRRVHEPCHLLPRLHLRLPLLPELAVPPEDVRPGDLEARGPCGPRGPLDDLHLLLRGGPRGAASVRPGGLPGGDLPGAGEDPARLLGDEWLDERAAPGRDGGNFAFHRRMRQVRPEGVGRGPPRRPDGDHQPADACQFRPGGEGTAQAAGPPPARGEHASCSRVRGRAGGGGDRVVSGLPRPADPLQPARVPPPFLFVRPSPDARSPCPEMPGDRPRRGAFPREDRKCPSSRVRFAARRGSLPSAVKPGFPERIKKERKFAFYRSFPGHGRANPMKKEEGTACHPGNWNPSPGRSSRKGRESWPPTKVRQPSKRGSKGSDSPPPMRTGARTGSCSLPPSGFRSSSAARIPF